MALSSFMDKMMGRPTRGKQPHAVGTCLKCGQAVYSNEPHTQGLVGGLRHRECPQHVGDPRFARGMEVK